MANFLNRLINSISPEKAEKEAMEDMHKVYQVPYQLQRIRQDALSRREAIEEAERAYFPHRVRMQQMYLNTKENGHIFACIERRKDLTRLRKWEFVNANGEVNQNVTDIFCHNVKGNSVVKEWFAKLVNYILDARFYGYSLVYLGDIHNGDFDDLEVVKRWFVSPDREMLNSVLYDVNGAEFCEDENIKDWYLYVPTDNETGTSKCGYGLFYELSIYEIFARNLLGFNGDFVELFSQPFRVGKTNKTEESERAMFAETLRDMGSSGWALLDAQDDTIEFLESSLGGNGFQGYDNFEKRLEDKISQIILGHSDAVKSIAGKLGNSNEDSPATQALEDKQTQDGNFVSSIINGKLFEQMRNLGFDIPMDVKAVLKNDNEQMEMIDSMAKLAETLKKGGLQLDAEYFTKQTGIPVTSAPQPQPQQLQKLPTSIQNKLNEIYR
jgi:hypothetical protein